MQWVAIILCGGIFALLFCSRAEATTTAPPHSPVNYFAVCQCKANLNLGTQLDFSRIAFSNKQFAGYISEPIYPSEPVCQNAHEGYCRTHCLNEGMHVGDGETMFDRWRFFASQNAGNFPHRCTPVKLWYSLDCLPESNLRYCPPIPQAFHFLNPKPSWISLLFYQPIPTISIEGPLHQTHPIRENVEKILQTVEGILSHPDTPAWAIGLTVATGVGYCALKYAEGPFCWEQFSTAGAAALLLTIATSAGAEVTLPEEFAQEVNRMKETVSVYRDDLGTTYEIQILEDPFEIFVNKQFIEVSSPKKGIIADCERNRSNEYTCKLY